MTDHDSAVAAILQILDAVEEITKALADSNPKLALDRATDWAKTIGTDRAYLLAMAQRQARDGRQAAQEIIANDAGDDLQEIGKLMHKWGWDQIERRDGMAVVTQQANVTTTKNDPQKEV